MVFYPDKLILKLLLAKKNVFFFFWLILCCRIKVVIPNVDFQAHKNCACSVFALQTVFAWMFAHILLIFCSYFPLSCKTCLYAFRKHFVHSFMSGYRVLCTDC